MSTQAKDGRNRFRASLDRARKIFSTPALWHQKPSSQENGDGHSLLHLEQAPPSNSPPEPSLPALTSGGTAATIQTSRAKSMTAPVASPRVAGTTAAPVPTLNRISSTAALPPRGTTPSAHSHLVSATRSTPAVHAEQSHPLVGRTSWLALNAPSNGTPAIDHRPQCPNNGPLAPEDSGAVLPPLIPQHSGPSTKAFPAVSARFCLDISSRSQQSPSVFSTSPPLSAVSANGTHTSRGNSNLSLQQLQPTPPYTPHIQHACSRSNPRHRASMDAVLSNYPHHPSPQHHHISPRPPRHPHLSPEQNHQDHLQQQHHHHHHLNHHQHQQQQVFSTPPVSSSGAGPYRKLRTRRSMDLSWMQEADLGSPLSELQQQALKELEELRKLGESKQPEQHEGPALRPTSPTLYAPPEDTSLRTPRTRLSYTHTVEPRGLSYTQKRRSSFLSLYGTDDEELSAQASCFSCTSSAIRSRGPEGIGAEASAGSSTNRDLDALPQDFLASSLYKLNVQYPSPRPPAEEQNHQTGPLPSHASCPHPPQQQQGQRTLQPTAPYAAAPPNMSSPHRPAPRRTGSVSNIAYSRESLDTPPPHRISSACGTYYCGMPLAADVAQARPQVPPLRLGSSSLGKAAPVLGSDCANQELLQPHVAGSAGGGASGGQDSHQQQQQQHTTNLGTTSPAKMAYPPRADPASARDTPSSFDTRLQGTQLTGRPPLPQHHAPHPPPQQLPSLHLPRSELHECSSTDMTNQLPPTHASAGRSSCTGELGLFKGKGFDRCSAPQELPSSTSIDWRQSAGVQDSAAATQHSSGVQDRSVDAPQSSPGAVHPGLQPPPPTLSGDRCTSVLQPPPSTSPSPLLVVSPELLCQEAGELQAPDVPSPSDWSKMAAQAADRRQKVSFDKGGRWQPRVSETNPVAFDDKAARGAEADYRAAAEHAHECIQGLSSTGASDPKASTQFLDAVQDLQAHRPYFVSPVRRREAVSRASFKESPPPEDSGHSDTDPTEQQAAGPQEWTLQSSTFGNRKFDSPEVLGQQFAKDWQRLASKPRLRKIVLRLLPAGATEADLEQELAKVRAVFATHQVVTRAAFLYYSCLGASVGLDSLMVLHLPDFHALTRDCHIADPKAPGAKPTELETAFIAANFDEGTEVTELKRRCAVDGVLRFEFMELLIRVSMGKFLVPKVTAQLSEAVSKLFEEHLIPHLPEAAKTPADMFRHRLYCQEVEAAFLQHWDLLQAVFKVYKAKDRTKLFWQDHWLALLTDLNLLGPHTGIDKACAKVLVGMSQMATADELKIRQRAVSLSLLDLLEALGRLSEVLSPPCLAEMAGSGDAAHLQSPTAQQQQQQEQQTSSSGSAAPFVQAVSEQKGSLMGFNCSVAEHINYIQSQSSLASQHAALSGMGGGLHTYAQQKPLVESFRPLLELLIAGLQARWGRAQPGESKWEVAVAKAQTVTRMLKVAQERSGGIELNR